MVRRRFGAVGTGGHTVRRVSSPGRIVLMNPSEKKKKHVYNYIMTDGPGIVDDLQWFHSCEYRLALVLIFN